MPPTSVGSLGGSLPCWADSCSSAWDIDISSCRYVMPVPDLSIACRLNETLCILEPVSGLLRSQTLVQLLLACNRL